MLLALIHHCWPLFCFSLVLAASLSLQVPPIHSPPLLCLGLSLVRGSKRQLVATINSWRSETLLDTVFGAVPMACGSSRVRDRTCATQAVTTLDP